ncbi:hypothetical protein EDB89DRAFT_2006571 [Lactarius sanguifluus]|nr:hypothetical protein EDB89DRAFT_2006571 [Lactarius sanguifluus]
MDSITSVRNALASGATAGMFGLSASKIPRVTSKFTTRETAARRIAVDSSYITVINHRPLSGYYSALILFLYLSVYFILQVADADAPAYRPPRSLAMRPSTVSGLSASELLLPFALSFALLRISARTCIFTVPCYVFGLLIRARYFNQMTPSMRRHLRRIFRPESRIKCVVSLKIVRFVGPVFACARTLFVCSCSTVALACVHHRGSSGSEIRIALGVNTRS